MRFAVPALFLAMLTAAVAASDEVRPVDKDKAWRDDRWNQMNVGQFVSSSIEYSNATIVRALSIKVGDNDEGSVCYDMTTGSMRLAWTGGFLHFDPTKFGVVHPPQVVGNVSYFLPKSDAWDYPVKYRGFFLDGKRVVLSYNVLAASVMESPWFETNSSGFAFTRSFEIEPSGRPLAAIVAAIPTNTRPLLRMVDGSQIAYYEQNGKTFAATVRGSPDAKLGISDNHFVVTFEPHSDVLRAKVMMTACESDKLSDFSKFVEASAGVEDLKALSKDGRAHWKPIEVTGTVAPSTEPYVVDTIPVPYDNPDKALMFITGVDFLDNGDAAVSTLHGDVWTVSGIDDGLQHLRWRRFATGLYQPLGLKVVNNKIYVAGRDRITCVRDLNGDGEADSYESFYNGIQSTAERHHFVTCLETDSRGNFYYVDPVGVHRVSPDGQSGATIAAGWRNPNGLSVSPSGVITVAPQQGEWTPSSAICEVKPGGWYGFEGPKVTPERPLGYDAPLCWIPHKVDNSSGGEVWVTSKKWGPLEGQLLHFSYGECSMMLVLREVVDGVAQAGVIEMKPHFISGAMRGTFNKKDGQLYVAGSLGWETKATKDGSLQRVRYTGQKVHLPGSLHAYANGLELGFTQPLDKSTAEDPGSYSIEQWNYHYQKKYGSKDYLPDNPDKEGHETVNVTSAKILPDGKSVFLQIDKLKPVMQMEIQFNVNAADGKAMRGEIYNTINKLAASKAL